MAINHRSYTLATLALLITIGGLFTTAVKADCSCLCVEGTVRAVCSSSVAPRPMCGPTSCAPAPEVRGPEPLVASPGQEWLYASPPNGKIGDDSYDWREFGEEP
jgi:hypothetical protein